LKAHRKFKHGSKQFECKTCMTGFSSLWSLERHKKSRNMASCEECSATFCNSRSVNIHLFDIHRYKVMTD
jgi:transcription elongation factor Elf1